MRIEKTHISYIKQIYVPRTYILITSQTGFEDALINVATAAASLPHVLIKGEEPFKQNKDIASLCKQIQQLNPYTHITIHTDGAIRPVGMNSIKNIQYVVFAKLKETGIPYSERVHEVSWQWLAKAGAKFVFNVEKQEDYDEINMIISGMNIKKSQIYICVGEEDFNELSFSACNYGYNLFIEFDGEWFDEASD